MDQIVKFCQTQQQIQLSWAELALILKYPASAARQPAQASSREASYEADIWHESFFQPH